MPLRFISFFSIRKPTGLFALAVFVLSVGLYIIFDLYLDSVGREIAGSWLQAETVAIQEGNLLSTITKNQRVLLSSQFVKGVKLVDTSTSDKRSLIEFGEQFKVNVPTNLIKGKVVSNVSGFLRRSVYYQVPERPDLVLSLETRSDFLTKSFFGAVTAFLFLLVFLFFAIRRIEIRRLQAENKNRILLGEIAERVAHDIRSPLNTLNAVLETIEDLSPKSKQLLTTSIQRIREIGLGIADHGRMALIQNTDIKKLSSKQNSGVEPILLFNLVEELIDEKRIQYQTRSHDFQLECESNSFKAFAAINSKEMRRSLSNLVDNAIEATKAGETILVKLSTQNDWLIITIIDEGKGIPMKELSRVGDKGFSFGKAGGTGIGVYYAKRAIKSWGGKLNITSVENKGTVIEIKIPVATTPSWFIDSIPVKDASIIVIVDDDSTVHAILKDKLLNIKPELNIEHFFDSDSASSWFVQNRKSLDKVLLLTDYNLNSRSGNGVTVLERCGLSSPSAVMISNSFEDRFLQESCEKLNVKIMPKSMMNHALIDVTSLV